MFSVLVCKPQPSKETREKELSQQKCNLLNAFCRITLHHTVTCHTHYAQFTEGKVPGDRGLTTMSGSGTKQLRSVFDVVHTLLRD